jgi:hypothetical protein
MSDENGGIWFVYEHPSGAAVGIEIDDRGAHAYFRQGGAIKGDVWLFNVREVLPRGRGDLTKGSAPANPEEYAGENSTISDANKEDFWLEWINSTDGRSLPTALIYFRGQLHAVVGSGMRPGFCRFAREAGPIARPLDDWRREHSGSDFVKR